MIYSPQPFVSNAKQDGTPSVYKDLHNLTNCNATNRPLHILLAVCDIVALAKFRFFTQVNAFPDSDDARTQIQFIKFCEVFKYMVRCIALPLIGQKESYMSTLEIVIVS